MPEVYEKDYQKHSHACNGRHLPMQILKPDEETKLLCVYRNKQKQYGALYGCYKQPEKKNART